MVLSHPDDDEAWWVDIKAELSEPTRRATRTVWVDKRHQVFDASAASDLLRRAVPKDSGLFLAAPPKRELLTSNLLPIIDMPETIYLAPAAASTYPAAGELLTAQADRSRSGWILRDGLVISFGDLREAPLHALCSGDVERHDAAGWADSTGSWTCSPEPSRPTIGVTCAGTTAANTCTSALPRTCNPVAKGGLLAAWAHGIRPVLLQEEPDTISFYRHAALTVRFRRFDGTWYCQLGPDYCFTSDGREEYLYADILLAGIKRLDRHAAVAGWIRTWATYLTQEPDLFDINRALTFGELKTFEVDRGIEDKLWGPAPVQTRDEPDEALDAAEVDATLDSVGIDTEDLVALDDEAGEQPSDTPAPQKDRPRRRSRPKSAARRGHDGGAA